MLTEPQLLITLQRVVLCNRDDVSCFKLKFILLSGCNIDVCSCVQVRDYLCGRTRTNRHVKRAHEMGLLNSAKLLGMPRASWELPRASRELPRAVR